MAAFAGWLYWWLVRISRRSILSFVFQLIRDDEGLPPAVVFEDSTTPGLVPVWDAVGVYDALYNSDGRRARAYGLYHGDGATRDDIPDRIVIYRDTLRRDFGHDPELLREQVTITVRHELAHHIGFDELGVRDLGL